MIKEYIHERFPDHLIVGEEETAAGGDVIPEMSAKPTWYIDPVDGTTNFIHSYPNSCVSIGLTMKKEPVVGVVFNPITREMFVGVKGRGSQLINVGGNDLNEETDVKTIRVSNATTLKKALIATEIGVGRDEKTIDAIMGRIRNIAHDPVHLTLLEFCTIFLIRPMMASIVFSSLPTPISVAINAFFNVVAFDTRIVFTSVSSFKSFPPTLINCDPLPFTPTNISLVIGLNTTPTTGSFFIVKPIETQEFGYE
jgi:hypothetical protein